MKTAMMVLLSILCMFAANAARADEAGQCQAADGSYLTGTVIQGPSFVPGHSRDGVELSHTHVTLRADRDGQLYDVAMDNVFASGYDSAGEAVPDPLSTIAVGTRLELCGELYQIGAAGIHWVHTDCGQPPTATAPDGWVKVLAPDGTPGPNLEASREYCKLWP